MIMILDYTYLTIMIIMSMPVILSVVQIKLTSPEIGYNINYKRLTGVDYVLLFFNQCRIQDYRRQVRC
jgi:hypothetical protein